MTNHILHLQRHFGKADSKTVGHKHRVVTKTVGTITLGKDDTVDTSFKIARLAIFYQAYHCAKACLAVGITVKGGKKFVDIVVE